MAQVLIKTVQACASGDHLDVASYVDGVQTGLFCFQIAELLEPIPPEGLQDAIKALVCFYAQGLTEEQLKAALLAGYEVTI